MRLVLTAGLAGAPVQAPKMLDDPCPRQMIADAAYSSAAIRREIQQAGATAGINTHPTHKDDPPSDRERYRHRNVIDRSFRCLRNFRRVATRYDKRPENFLGFVWLASLFIQLK